MSAATVLRNGLLIDGRGREPIQGATVVIEDGNVTQVGKDSAVDAPR